MFSNLSYKMKKIEPEIRSYSYYNKRFNSEKGILITLEGGIAGILRGDGAVVPLEDIFK